MRIIPSLPILFTRVNFSKFVRQVEATKVDFSHYNRTERTQDIIVSDSLTARVPVTVEAYSALNSCVKHHDQAYLFLLSLILNLYV